MRLRRARKVPEKELARKLIETTVFDNVKVETVLEDQRNLVRASACENCSRFT